MIKYYSLVNKDHRILKLVFFIFAAYLIIEEFYTFLIIKPTYTSNFKRAIKAEDFPEIIVCPMPAIDINAAKLKGYRGSLPYFMGVDSMWNLKSIGWAGNNSEDVQKVVDDISTIKTIEDCPSEKSSLFWSKGSNSSPYKSSLKFNITKALYPNHICCKVVPHNILDPVFAMQFSFLNGSFKVLMSDPLTNSFFDRNKKIMQGDKIMSADNDIKVYKVQIIQNEKLPDDPKYPCIDYKLNGEYAKCVDEEIVRQNFRFRNCTPPWMTFNKDLWCEGIQINSTLEGSDYRFFLSELSVSEGDYGKCLVPCKTKLFMTKEIGVQSERNHRGITIWFEKDVEINYSTKAINPKTLISSIGGFIGIGKNLLWIMIMVMSGLGFLINNLKQT